MTDHDTPFDASAPEPTPPASERLLLGTVALRLGIGAISCGGLAGAAWIAPGMASILSWLAVLTGIAAVIVGIIAIVKNRARKHAVIGLILTAAAAPVALLAAFVTTVIFLAVSLGFSG